MNENLGTPLTWIRRTRDVFDSILIRNRRMSLHIATGVNDVTDRAHANLPIRNSISGNAQNASKTITITFFLYKSITVRQIQRGWHHFTGAKRARPIQMWINYLITACAAAVLTHLSMNTTNRPTIPTWTIYYYYNFFFFFLLFC